MPTAKAAVRLGAVRPVDAVAAFQQRGLLRPSFRWQDVDAAEHARAFAVAGVMRLDILRIFRDGVDAAVNGGMAPATFAQQVREQLVAKGFWGDVEVTDPGSGELRKTRFNDARLRLIFDVNLRQSHAAGRWARAQRSKMPYLVYRTMRDERVRLSHRSWDNLVLPKNHPWWDTHYPPNGWRCRCLAFATDDAGLEQLRKTAPKDAPVRTEPPVTHWVEYVNRSSGLTERVPHGVDPGFAYNPGKAHVAQGVARLTRELSAVRPLNTGTPAADEALALTRAVVARQRSEAGFSAFLKAPPPGDVGLPVAVLPAVGSDPAVASVAAQALRLQLKDGGFPRPLPVTAAGWALAQAIIDQGQSLALPGERVLWWWQRRTGGEPSVLVMELQRTALVWWVQRLATLTLDEAARGYPPLAALVKR